MGRVSASPTLESRSGNLEEMRIYREDGSPLAIEAKLNHYNGKGCQPVCHILFTPSELPTRTMLMVNILMYTTGPSFMIQECMISHGHPRKSLNATPNTAICRSKVQISSHAITEL